MVERFTFACWCQFSLARFEAHQQFADQCRPVGRFRSHLVQQIAERELEAVPVFVANGRIELPGKPRLLGCFARQAGGERPQGFFREGFGGRSTGDFMVQGAVVVRCWWRTLERQPLEGFARNF